MTTSAVARRYANAMFALGQQAGEGAITRYGQALSGLAEMLAASPRLDVALKSPVISIEEKKAVMARLLDSLEADGMVRNFCFLLADNERLVCLREIASCYGTLLDKAQGIVRGRLTTAVPLPDGRQHAIRTELGQKSGAQIELDFAVDESILGGMVLNMGDRVLDASLRAQLEILRETFKRGE